MQQDIASFQVTMNDPKTRIFMKIKNSSSNATDDSAPCFPIQLGALDWIYNFIQYIYQILLVD